MEPKEAVDSPASKPKKLGFGASFHNDIKQFNKKIDVELKQINRKLGVASSDEVKSFKNQLGAAATLDENSLGDQALLHLARQPWFKMFIIISAALALLEPILLAFPDQTLTAQRIVLAASTVLFIFGYGVTMAVMPHEVPLLARFRAAFLPEVWLEVFSFVIGWALIIQDPGMAALRCFRVLRFVWYTEFYRASKRSIFYPLTFLSHLVLQYLEKIGQELFTTQSKGGVIVLCFFFYMAYVMGVAFWIRTANVPLASPEGGATGLVSECDTLPHCFLIMLRLTFWDGSGFDYLKSIMDANDDGLATLLILYMCFSAMVLLNGMIGIFGGAFQAATQDIEEEEEEEKEKEEEQSENQKKEMKELRKDALSSLARIEDLCRTMQKELDDLKAEHGTALAATASLQQNGQH